MTASAKECPEKLRLNGRDVYDLAFIHRHQTRRVLGKGNRIKTVSFSQISEVLPVVFLTLTLFRMFFYIKIMPSGFLKETRN